MQNFGEWLDGARVMRGWTYDQLGKKIGTGKGYVNGIVHGKVNPPSVKMCRRIAKAFRCNPIDVIIRSQTEKMEETARAQVLRAYEIGTEFQEICRAGKVTVPFMLDALKTKKLVMGPGSPIEKLLDAATEQAAKDIGLQTVPTPAAP